MYEQVNGLCEQKKYDEALTLLNEAITNSPNSDSLYYYQGLVYTDYLKKQEEALISFKKSVEINPQFAYSYFGIGKANLELNRLDTAITALLNATKLKSDFIEAWLNLGYAYYLKGTSFSAEREKALLCYNRAIEINPEYPDSYLKRGIVLYENNKYTEAQTDFDSYYVLMLDKVIDTLYYFYTGFTAYFLNDYQTAVDQLDIYLTMDSLDVDGLMLYGLACNNSGDFTKAIAPLTKVTEMDSTNSEAYNLLGLAWYNSEDITRAYLYYKKAALLGNKEAAKQIKSVYTKKMQKVTNPALGLTFTLHPYWSCEELADTTQSFCSGVIINDTYLKLNIAVVKNDLLGSPTSEPCEILGHRFTTNGQFDSYASSSINWNRLITSETWNYEGSEYPISVWILKQKISNNKLIVYIWGKPEDMKAYQIYIDEFLVSINLKTN
jgi:tetratricopeptide (TPR) repeat protein